MTPRNLTDPASRRESASLEVKGLVLCGGRGTRLRPLTSTRAKQLIPVANKPVLFYVIEDLAEAGIRRVGVVVSPETGAAIRDALGDGSRWGVELTFVEQDSPLGIAHAIKTARSFLEDAPFVVYLGDCLLQEGISDVIDRYRTHTPEVLALVTPVDDPGRFGLVAVDGHGRVVQVVEKPRNFPSNLALVGVYVFDPAVHEAIETLRPSQRGEYEVTDAIRVLLDRGCRVLVEPVRGWWKDAGTPQALLEANRLVLSRQMKSIAGEVTQSRVTGENVVEEGSRVARCVVRGPVHVATKAVVEDSRIGPYTSIGRGAKVVRCNVADSIILDGGEVSELPWPLAHALIGQDATVRGPGTCPRRRRVRLLLGDHSHVSF